MNIKRCSCGGATYVTSPQGISTGDEFTIYCDRCGKTQDKILNSQWRTIKRWNEQQDIDSKKEIEIV